jgi:hypothetical protein
MAQEESADLKKRYDSSWYYYYHFTVLASNWIAKKGDRNSWKICGTDYGTDYDYFEA